MEVGLSSEERMLADVTLLALDARIDATKIDSNKCTALL